MKFIIKLFQLPLMFFICLGLISLSNVSLAASHKMMAAKSPATPAPATAMAYIISPQHGDVVGETFVVKFGLRGMGVAPAGVDKKNTGHHHLLIDQDQLPDLSKPLGKDVKHFGGGQTEVELSLPKGKHSLQLILGDKFHIPHNPPVVSEKISIEVR